MGAEGEGVNSHFPWAMGVVMVASAALPAADAVLQIVVYTALSSVHPIELLILLTFSIYARRLRTKVSLKSADGAAVVTVVIAAAVAVRVRSVLLSFVYKPLMTGCHRIYASSSLSHHLRWNSRHALDCYDYCVLYCHLRALAAWAWV